MFLFYSMHDPLHYLEQKFTQTTCVVLMFWTITSQMSLCNCMCNPLCYVKQRLHFITDFIISPLKCFSDTWDAWNRLDNHSPCFIWVLIKKWQHKQILWSFVLFFQMIRLQTRDLFFTLPERKLVLRMLSAKEFLRCWPKHLPLLLFIGYLERQDNGTVIWSFCI